MDPGTPAEGVSLDDVASYLNSSGWRREEEVLRGATIWTLGDKEEVLVPVEPGYRDQASRLRAVVRTLAEVEHRSELEIVQDIVDPMVDKQYYRTQPPTPSGTIPLPTAIKALEGIRDLMGAAARSLLEGPRVVFRDRRPQRITDFLNLVRLGTTQPGSYILTARVPLNFPRQAAVGLQETSTIRESQTRDSDLPSGREIVKQMLQAVAAARDAASQVAQGGHRQAFVTTVESGVSAELCEALARLGGSHNDQPFEVRFSWARGAEDNPPESTVRFDASAARIVAQGAKDLRSLAATGEAVITGRIERLYPVDRRIMVRGQVEWPDRRMEEQQAVWVRLSASLYREVAEQHLRREVLFRFAGHLLTIDRRVEMILDRQDFEIIGRGQFPGQGR